MKHPVRTIVIDLILIVLLVGLLIGAGFVEEINNASISLGGISFGINSDAEYMADDSYERGEGSVKAAEVTSLDIAWIAGEVKFVLTDGDTIVIRESSDQRLEENEIVRWKLENGRLSIRYATKSKVFGNMPEKRLTIEIPAIDWQIGYANILTVSANVELPTLNARDLDFDSVSGGLNVSSFVGETVDIDTVSGEVTLRNAVVSGQVSLSAVSGGLDYTGTAGSIETDAVSGDVKLVLTAAPSNIEADSTSGDVTITLPADVAGFDAELDTVSGELSNDFGSQHYGDGSLEIEVDTTSGDLRIKKS